jgi:hypothetical protein
LSLDERKTQNKTLRPPTKRKQADAAVALRFVADTPTITMSRLKALLTVRRRGVG